MHQKPNIIYRLFSGFLRIVFFLYIDVKVQGLENLDKNESYLYISNHNSWIDPVILFAYIPRNQKITLFAEQNSGHKKKFIAKLINLTKIDILDFDRSDKSSRLNALRKATKIVKQGNSMLVFPEGRLNNADNSFYPFYKGSFFAARQNETTIMPIYIRGSEQIYFRRKIIIAFGKPIETNRKQNLEILGTNTYYYMKDELCPLKPNNNQKKKRFDITNLFLGAPLDPPKSSETNTPLTDGNSSLEHFRKAKEDSIKKYNLE